MSLLELPVWKFAALVEAWSWEHFDEKHHGELSMELRREVDWKWVKIGRSVSATRTNPLRWQENKQGESLLSKHRKD